MAFPALALFNLFREPIHALPTAISTYISAIISVKRLQEFLRVPLSFVFALMLLHNCSQAAEQEERNLIVVYRALLQSVMMTHPCCCTLLLAVCSVMLRVNCSCCLPRVEGAGALSTLIGSSASA